MTKLRVFDIVDGTTVDGPGLRTSIYFAGCRHRCPGCHNPQTWDMAGGRQMGIDEIIDRVRENDFNVTFTGGDPLYQIDGIVELAKAVRRLGKRIWCYTGFEYEQIVNDGKMRELLEYVEVIVDGEFVRGLRDISLLFRGSSNQRLVDVKKSTAETVAIWKRE